jgi:uncharacterized protein involved in exopolysaccharide biosynthesis
MARAGGWWIVAAAVVPAVAVALLELTDHDRYAAEAMVLVTPGVVAGRDATGSAARDAVAVLGGQALVAYVRDDLDLEVDPPVVEGRVAVGSNVVVVRVESDDQDTVADVANSYALALVDVRGEQLRAGFGGASAEVDRRLELLGEELAAVVAELADLAGEGPDVAALERRRDALEQRRAHLEQRRDDTAIDGAATTGDLQVVRLAERPEHRDGDRWWPRVALVGLIGGALGALVVAVTSVAGRRRRGDAPGPA